MQKNLAILIVFILSGNILSAQDGSDIKFGKITSSDFQVTAPKFDTGANAVIIADIGKTGFEGNGKGFFSIVYTHFVRIKILNKNGFDAGDYEILLYNDRKFNQATFPVEQYATLRDFFAFVVKKESEQIVFKKIK